MTQHPLSETWYYKRFGTNGLRWFAFIWFPTIFAMLIATAGTIICCAFFYPAEFGNLTAWFAFGAGFFGVWWLWRMYRGFRLEFRQFEAEVGNELPAD